MTASRTLGTPALSGLRRGEIAKLRWSDIDFDTGVLTIANNRVSAGGRAVENDPKSAMPRRTLPLPVLLVGALHDARERQRVERIEAASAYRSGTGVVFNEVGDPYSLSSCPATGATRSPGVG